MYIDFARRVGNERLINACRCGESFGEYGYLIIEEILRKHLDKLQFETETIHTLFMKISEEENITNS